MLHVSHELTEALIIYVFSGNICTMYAENMMHIGPIRGKAIVTALQLHPQCRRNPTWKQFSNGAPGDKSTLPSTKILWSDNDHGNIKSVVWHAPVVCHYAQGCCTMMQNMRWIMCVNLAIWILFKIDKECLASEQANLLISSGEVNATRKCVFSQKLKRRMVSIINLKQRTGLGPLLGLYTKIKSLNVII